MRWSIVYEKAIRDDGSLLFPERLTKEFLEQQRKSMGSYFFANQYQNEIIPDEERRFRPEWLRYYSALPSEKHTFIFIDPAIGQRGHHDFTGIAVIDADTNGAWYLKVAARYRLTPTEIISKIFDLNAEFKPLCIGIESVAYQEAILYFLDEQMRKRNEIIPVKGITRSKTTKESRILALVPRFEWGRLFVARGMVDFEDEYLSFPRGKFDDILDALASLEEIVYYPIKKEITIERPNSQTHKDYERWYINQLKSRTEDESSE